MNLESKFIVQNVAENRALGEEIITLVRAGWTRFLAEDPVSWPLWPEILAEFPDFHFALLEPETKQLMAAGMTVPLAWDGELSELLDRGWHWVLRQSLDDRRHGRKVHTLSAANAVVHPNFRGYGLAEQIVFQMKRIAETHGFRRYIAPLRPTQKEKYPLTPIERYAQWTRKDGMPFDPWLRVQKRLGAEIIGCARNSIWIDAPLAQWETWTGLVFPDSGEYILPGGAVPMVADRKTGRGVYVAPSIWIAHKLS
ncbi:MAG: GNAT family N-acetyltransferase [Planctomycetia bacterium]|nr:GNAT family N-acetyltransferase [Planctomycetia bacterium]